jgi:hypothetical protein
LIRWSASMASPVPLQLIEIRSSPVIFGKNSSAFQELRYALAQPFTLRLMVIQKWPSGFWEFISIALPATGLRAGSSGCHGQNFASILPIRQ